MYCILHPKRQALADPRPDCTPYLLSLGLTKSRTSLVWIAGPLSGLIMQPIVGVFSDRSRSRWGRRRPFMAVGAVMVGICLLVLGWASEVAGIFVADEKAVCRGCIASRLESSTNFGQRKSVTVALAVLCIYAVDFSINTGTLKQSTRWLCFFLTYLSAISL